MTAGLFSPNWHRIAPLTPRWRLNVRVDRHHTRGETWYVLSNAVGQRSNRLDAIAYGLVGRCDGQTRLDDIWQALLENDADRAPTQDDVLSIVSQLVAEGFLECQSWPDINQLISEEDRLARSRRASRFNPLSLRIALGNPSRLLRRQTRWAFRLFSLPGLCVWLTLLGFACLQGLAHFDELSRHAALWIDTPRYWLLAWVCFAPVKLVHEWAHALAVRRWGGQVREVGIGLLMFFPAPYVDASEASRFVSSRQRALVSAAGILAELALAALALLIWLNVENGWLRDIAFSVLLIGSVSTLLFNANPLMRMDGYFVLTDLLQLPNLAVRSAEYWRNTWQRLVLGVPVAQTLTASPGEKKWLVAYAPLAWGYRLTICLWLVVWSGELHRWLGYAAAVLLLLWLIVLPLSRLLTQAQRSAGSYRQRLLAPARLAMLIVGVSVLTCVLPLPDTRIAQGVVWPHDDTQLRASIDGFVKTWHHEPGKRVDRETLIIELHDPVLQTDLARAELRRDGLMTDLYSNLRSDPARSRQLQEQLSAVDADHTRISERLDQLRVVAGSDGEVGLARPDDLPGRFFKQGELLGVIRTTRPALVRVVLAQDEAARIAERAAAVTVRLAEAPSVTHNARFVRQQPAAAEKLPSAALAEVNGGTIAVDPTDKDGTKPAFPTFLIDVELTGNAAGENSSDDNSGHLGARAWVRFDFGWTPLGSQMLRALRQTVRVRFAGEPV